MTSRRSFLNLLASTPVAAPIAAKEAINQAAEEIGMGGFSGSNFQVEEMDESVNPIWIAIRKALDDNDDTKIFRDEPMPVAIASKKSWSAVFKASEAHKIHLARRRRSKELRRIAYGDDPYHVRAAKLIAMGLKVEL